VWATCCPVHLHYLSAALSYLIGIVIKLLNIINTLKTQKKFWKALKCFEALAEGTTSTWQPQSQDNERGYVGEVEEADMFYK
jgi:hypothetical protein